MSARIGEGKRKSARRLQAKPLHAKRVSIYKGSTPFLHSTRLRFTVEQSLPVADIVETSAAWNVEFESGQHLQLLVTLELRGNERRFLL
jgi:hypothetical protein